MLGVYLPGKVGMDILQKSLGLAEGFVHRIKIRLAVPPVVSKLRRLPLTLPLPVSEELCRVEELDVIERVNASELVSSFIVIGHQLQRRCLGCPWEAVQGCNQWRPRGTSVAYARMHRSGEATWCCTSGCTQASVRFGATCAAAHLQATQTWCDTCARTPVSDPFSARCARPLSHSAATPVPTTSVCMAGQHQWHEATGLPALPLTARTIDTTVTPIGHRLQQRCLGHPWEPVQGCNQWGPRGTSVAYARMHRSGEATWCCTSGCTQASVRFGATCAAARLQAAQTWCATSARTLASDRFSARCARPLSPGVATSVFTSACMTCRQQRLNATGFPALPLTARGIDTAVTPASAFTRLSLFGRS
ncbi:uncharacterized protein [Dermacentor albipictus]|uniref:uncharacterized protein isoform X5 n=1 Tax=Dermacentor albipictus TaxID=60249 RepID=UPI0038FC36C6